MIASAIAERQAELAAENGLSQQWVLDRLKENAARAAQAEPVLDSKGKPTGEYQYEGAVVNRSVELIGKHLGMFVDRQEVQHKGKVQVEVRFEREGRRITSS